MNTQFGNTWWGEKWINSIEDADYSNRLPRGKSYARNGAVCKIQVKYGHIEAKVQGSGRKPYDIQISLKSFNKTQKQRILKIIKGNPIYLSALLTKNLPEQLYYDCEAQGIHIFPKKWDDFNADCSCPDWADCCKHIAAVIYIVGNEIDRNPFLSFILRGFDILKEFDKNTADEHSSKNNSDIRNINDFFEIKKTEIAGTWAFNKKVFEELDFTTIPDSKERIFTLLSNNPLFGTKRNFKSLLIYFYRDICLEAKYSGTYNSPEEEDDYREHTEYFTENSIFFNSDLSLNNVCFESFNRRIQAYNIDDSLLKVLNFAAKIPLKSFELHEKTLLSFSLITKFSLKIIEKGAFIPEILKFSDKKSKKYFIRYVPALIFDEVKSLFDKIVEIIPKDLIQIINKKELKFSKIETVKILFSLIVRAFSFRCSKYHDFETAVERTFFNNTYFIPKSFEELEIPNTINLWLSRLHLVNTEYIPVLVIKEKGNDFILDLLIENRDKQLVNPIPFTRLFLNKKYSGLKLEILKILELAREYLPEITKLLESQGKEKPLISGENLSKIFFSSIPILKLLRIPILFPKGMEDFLMPKVAPIIKKKLSKQETISYFSLESMLEFDYKIALGNSHVSFDEFKKLIREKRGIIKFKDQYVYIDESEMQKMIKQFENPKEISANEKIQTIFSGEYKGTPIVLDESLKMEIQKLLKIDVINTPKNLKAKLRPYQLLVLE